MQTKQSQPKQRTYTFTMPARVGIIGGGNVGQTLGRQLVKKGRAVVFGSRNPSKLQQDLTDKGLAAVEALPIADAVSRSDVVLLAVPGECSVLRQHCSLASSCSHSGATAC